MPRLAAAIAITIALSGCTRRQADFAWVAIAVAAEVARASNDAPEGSPGVAVAAPVYVPAGPSPAEQKRQHDLAFELTQIAAREARANHCEAVVRTSDQVRVIDMDVFVNVFLADLEIQRCLAIAPSPSES